MDGITGVFRIEIVTQQISDFPCSVVKRVPMDTQEDTGLLHIIVAFIQGKQCFQQSGIFSFIIFEDGMQKLLSKVL